jgi:hypothetical protein
MNTRITELQQRGKQVLHEEGWLSFLKKVLLYLVYLVNKVLRPIADKVLLSRYISQALERIYRFYTEAVSRREGRRSFVPVSSKNLLDIKRILDKAGIRFWLIFGTFLGAYRDQAIIPFDGDTDLAIYSEDLPALVGYFDAFAKEGFELRVGPAIEAVCPVGLCRDGERTGIAIFKLEGSKRVWKSIKYDASAFETFNEIQFLGQNWRILSDPERWLKYTYGEDWRTPIEGKGVGAGYAHGEKFESARAIE